jgi:predicted nuclease of restriction endonuclease-like (RecB) superfamily
VSDKQSGAPAPRDPNDASHQMQGYGELLEGLKARIRTAQVRAALAVNRELVLLYWEIGREILTRQRALGWGAKVIDRLSDDLRRAFPGVSGYSARNLKYMRAFAEAYPEEAFVQEPLAQITWYHNVTLLDKVKDPAEREWYVRRTIEHGWSRNVLVHQIESGLYNRQGRAITNFERTLPAPQSDLARELIKDPYHFDFFELGEEAKERDLERALLAHLRDFLLELGVGFAFVGSQHHLEVGGQDYYLDLLFYHLRLRCYVVIELKIGAFRPEDSGKVNFYLSAVDAQLRHAEDRPSIGLILCKERNRVVVEYSLRDVEKPIGVSEYRLAEHLPEKLRGSLPSVEELERELGDVEGEP